MRRKSEHGCEPQPVWYAWIVALACMVMTGLAPAGALAEEPEATQEEAVTEETEAAPDTEATDDEVTQEELDEAAGGDRGGQKDSSTKPNARWS